MVTSVSASGVGEVLSAASWLCGEFSTYAQYFCIALSMLFCKIVFGLDVWFSLEVLRFLFEVKCSNVSPCCRYITNHVRVLEAMMKPQMVILILPLVWLYVCGMVAVCM